MSRVEGGIQMFFLRFPKELKRGTKDDQKKCQVGQWT